MKYREMVEEAVTANVSTFYAGVRLWRYTLLLSEARVSDYVKFRDVVPGRGPSNLPTLAALC
jgi:hypothetical protein